MATATNDADVIRHKMAQIRHELHADVRDVVANAEAVADWRRYIGMYPWAALGVSVAVGYLIVPKRHKVVAVPVAISSDSAEVREVIAKEKGKEEVKDPVRKGLVASALGFVAPVAIRAVQGYALQYLENWIVQQHATAGGAAPAPPNPSGMTGRPQEKPTF
ncbi:hypothetical protein V5E97_00530 [Singulisphaera sp. Ch08]|uniref:DUF3618 domain-containing protein n=1 Tax=Singulisphaera sp. Ch08 TaxID=3120278 RepID=A0AAU7CGQ0_9BACT